MSPARRLGVARRARRRGTMMSVMTRGARPVAVERHGSAMALAAGERFVAVVAEGEFAHDGVAAHGERHRDRHPGSYRQLLPRVARGAGALGARVVMAACTVVRRLHPDRPVLRARAVATRAADALVPAVVERAPRHPRPRCRRVGGGGSRHVRRLRARTMPPDQRHHERGDGKAPEHAGDPPSTAGSIDSGVSLHRRLAFSRPDGAGPTDIVRRGPSDHVACYGLKTGTSESWADGWSW